MFQVKKLFYLLFLCVQFHLQGQEQTVFIPRDIRQAIQKGTRSYDGTPGESYFQNRADYLIHAEYFPQSGILKGQSFITYTNNSNVRLNYIVLRVSQNVFQKGGIRGRRVDPSDVNDGVKISKIIINDKAHNPDSHIINTQTNMVYPMSLKAGEKASLEVEWEFTMPKKTTNRFGCYNSGACFIAYWFPQIAVFDDIHGWDLSDYTGIAEFYNSYGNFNVHITVPQNYLVWATGVLTNSKEVLSDELQKRYLLAKQSGEIIQIIGETDIRKKTDLTKRGKNTWKFEAINVNDFAFGTANNYRWDATSVEIRDKTGKINSVLIETAYDTKSVNFRKVAEIASWSVKDYSEDLPGIPYPYPKLTVFNGSGGMEFPMIKNDGETDSLSTLFLTTHEIGHSYFPFMVGTNQRRHGWLDEGLVTLLGQEQHYKRDSTLDFRKMYTHHYPVVSGTQADVPPLVNSGFITDDIFQVHEYMRPSLAFWTLRDILGRDLFKTCLREFIKTWEGKHPTPWDLFALFEKTSGIKLDWFFDPWFGQFCYPDLMISSVIEEGSSTHVEIKNKGGMPFPSILKIIYTDNSEGLHSIPATAWAEAAEHIVVLEKGKSVKMAELITEGYPDTDTGNNIYWK